MYGMGFKKLKIGNVCACLVYKYMAKLLKRLRRGLFKARMNLIKNVGKLKIINFAIKLKTNKISNVKSTHIFKHSSLVNII